MNKVVVGVVAAALVGAAAFGTLIYPEMHVKRELDKIIAELPAEHKASYKTLKYSLFSDRLELTGLELATPDANGAIVTSTVEKVSLTGARKDRVEHLSASGLAMHIGDDSVRMTAGTFTMQGLSASEGLLVGVLPTQTVKLAQATFGDVSVVANGEPLKMREIDMRDIVQVGKNPLSVTMGLHGIEVDVKTLPDEDAREGLTALGYDKLSLNLDMSYVNAPDKRHLSVKKLAFSGDNVGSLGLAFDLGNLDTEVAAESPMGAIAAVQAATLESLELRYDDASLAGRLLKLSAQSSGMGEAEMRASLLAQLSDVAAQNADQPLARDLIASLSTFVGEPKSLTLNMKPTKPLPLMQVMAVANDPATFVQSTGMTVSANR